MEEAEDKKEETEEELKAKKNMEIAAEAEETKRLAVQVKQEVEKFLVAEETERQAEAMSDMNETKKTSTHTMIAWVLQFFFFFERTLTARTESALIARDTPTD